MANPEHVLILDEGVDAWNSWRDKQHDLVPDLSGIDLTGRFLQAINFSGVNLRVFSMRV